MNQTLLTELEYAREKLRRAQLGLRFMRVTATTYDELVKRAEAEVCRWLDRVWEAQEDYKAAVRHFA